MKAFVYVTMKKTVLDPQGATVARALNSLGHSEIGAVRQGKYFEIELAEGTTREQAAAKVDRIAAEVLSNPVIEEYRLEIAD
jgi:phosphoribosylformylglycinamidine synthase